MPNAFSLRLEPDRLQKHFALAQRPRSLADAEACAPGALVATIEWNAHGRAVCQLARFGFRMRDGVLPMTNFRHESIKPSAPSRSFTEGRCIVPADTFSEQVAGPGGAEAAAYAANDGRLLGLAGMLRPEASGLSVAILTVPALPVVRSINRRMPAILFEDDYATWMDDTTTVADALALIRHSHDDRLVERPATDTGGQQR